jgi:hypothetical protein
MSEPMPAPTSAPTNVKISSIFFVTSISNILLLPDGCDAWILNSRTYCGKMHAPKTAFWSMIATRKAVSANFRAGMDIAFELRQRSQLNCKKLTMKRSRLKSVQE